MLSSGITGKFNSNLSTFLSTLSDSTKTSIFFNSNSFDSIRVDESFSNANLSFVLESVLKKTPYTFIFINPSSIVIVPKQTVESIINRSSIQTASLNNIQIVGEPREAGKSKRPNLKSIIVDGKTGEPIIGATVAIENTNLGGSTDLKGGYVFSLQPGIYNLLTSSVGYEEKKTNIKLISTGELIIELFEKSIKLDEVIVSRQRADKNIRNNQMSIIEMDKKMLKQLPPVLGEKDVIKSVSMMPGVKSVGEFGSGINVRGGSNDQNLFLLEGAPVFNTSHVFGLQSAINPDAVNNLTLYKGYIPPAYGERISSVMDIQMKEGNFSEYHSNGGIGLLNSRLMIEGPIDKNKTSFLIGGRTSYSNWLLKKIPDVNIRNSSANFYDINASLSIMPDEKSKISVFGYVSNDRFKYGNEIDYSYHNYLASINWSLKNLANTVTNISFVSSHYGMDKSDISQISEKNTITTGIGYNSLKIGFTNNRFSKHIIDYGIQGIYYNVEPGKQQPLNNESITPHKNLADQQAIESAAYLGDQFEIARSLTLQGGLRFSYYALLGPARVFNYTDGIETSSKLYNNGDIVYSDYNLEPRAALKYVVNDATSLKASYNHNVQYLSLITYTSVSTPDDIWKLSNNYLKPSKCDHYALGLYRNFLNNAIETSAEVYYKNLSDLIEYKSGAQISMNEKIEADLFNTNGKNYGIELLLKKNNGKLDGWISYTYSRSLKQTYSALEGQQINNNSEYPSSYDKPHDLTVMATYHKNKRLRFSCTFYYSTGRPITLPQSRFLVTDNNIPVVNYSSRNEYRLPDFHRMDFSMSIDESLRIKKKWKGSWTFSVINVYARKNAYTIIYKKKESEPNTPVKYGLYKLYIIGQQLPTITYNFIF